MDLSDTDAFTVGPRTHRRARSQQPPGLPTQFPRKRHQPSRSTGSITTAASSAVLPEYTPKMTSPPLTASDAPPTYTDVDAEDEEDDDEALPLPMSSALGRRRTLTGSLQRRRSYTQQSRSRRNSTSTINEANSDDPYLDSLLARSVQALELSNALLQSTMSTKTSLASVLESESILDRSLARQQRNLSTTLREGHEMQAAWMGEMRSVVKGVEDLFDDDDDDEYLDSNGQAFQNDYWPRTGSLPSTSDSPLTEHFPSQPSAHLLRAPHSRTTSSSSGGGLRRGDRPRSPPPRALTQYVSVAHSRGTTTETTANESSIYLPSTTGLRSAAHIEGFSPSYLPSPQRSGFSSIDSGSDHRHRGMNGRPYDAIPGFDDRLSPELTKGLGIDHMPPRASHQSFWNPSAAPARKSESPSLTSSPSYINRATPSLASPSRSTFSESPDPRLLASRAKSPPQPPPSSSPRIVLERRPTRSPPPPPSSTSRYPYKQRPSRVSWSTPDLTTASLLLHTTQQPGYRPSQSRASSASSRESASRTHQQHQSRTQPVPHSSTFDPERYFSGLEPIPDSEGRSSPELERSNSKGKTTNLSAEDGKERKGRTFATVAKLRKLLDTSPSPALNKDKEDPTTMTASSQITQRNSTDLQPTNGSGQHVPLYKRRSASVSRLTPRFLPSPSMLPSTTTSTATASVARMKAIPLTPAEEEEERRKAAEKRRSGFKGSRQNSAQGTPVMGFTPLAPDLNSPNPPANNGNGNSGTSTPRSVTFAVEPPKYSEERAAGGGGEGRAVERGRSKKKKQKNSKEDEAKEAKGIGTGWMSWFLSVPPPSVMATGRMDERLGARSPGGPGSGFDFGL